jgi:excisionase family DNA binding protein
MTAVQEITVREAAHRTRRSPETIRRWIWSGRLPAVKRGNTYYVDVVHLDGLAVEMGGAGHAAGAPGAPDPAGAPGPAGPGSLRAWLADLGEWKSGLAGEPAAGRTASDLVIEDRHARR